MTIEVVNNHLDYLIEQIRGNLLNINGNEKLKETPRAHAWLLTTLSIYGDQLQVLIDLYRLFREQNSYILLSFIIEHILQYHINEIENNSYLQQEFQCIFSNRLNTENDKFSYSYLYSLLSNSTREIISSLLIRQWYHELEENLFSSIKSFDLLNKCREKALACLKLSSSSISSILELILNTEIKIDFNIQITSLNILRCLFVQDLLPIVLENHQIINIQSHLCHKWLIYAIEFYLEYFIKSLNQQIKLEGNTKEIYQCENPIEKIDKLIYLALNIQQNFNWQQFSNQIGSTTNHRQKLLELHILINRIHNSTIHCPLECFVFCISFPIYIKSIVNLLNLLNNEIYKDYIFIYSTSSIKILIDKQNEYNHIELIENFYLFIECLNILQQSQISTCLKLYQDIINKLQLNSNISIYQRLLKIFYFYYTIEKSKKPKDKQINDNKTITIDDTPQSPTMQDDSNQPISTPLICPDIDNLIQQFNDDSLESRLQLCSLYPLSQQVDQKRVTVSFCIDTLIYVHDNYSPSKQSDILLSISSDYCFIPRSYLILFDYLLDLLLQYLPPTLILLQIKYEHLLSSIYPKNLFSTLTPISLRYIYDQKLLRQLLKYIQSTTKSDRRWITNNNKRKLDSEQNKLTDEQFIEKIIQHVSNITQWTDEQRRSAIYTYIIDERQTLLQSL